MKFKTDTENDRSENCRIPKLMEKNFKVAEQLVIEETPSWLAKEVDNLVLPDCWNEKTSVYVFRAVQIA